jgi:hypothetical protein
MTAVYSNKKADAQDVFECAKNALHLKEENACPVGMQQRLMGNSVQCESCIRAKKGILLSNNLAGQI